MAQKTGLGKGLETLIPQNFDTSFLLAEDERIQKIDINNIYPNKMQPRTHFDDEALRQLAGSIKNHGILQPLVVTPGKDGKYMLIAGERRWRASKIAGLKTVPVIVRSTKDLQQLELALVENVQRENLTPLDQATSMLKLHDQFNLSYQEIGQRVGKAGTTVTNIVRLLELPKAAKEALKNKEISEGHARSILALKDKPDKQSELLNFIKRNGWSVRQAEQFVIASKTGIKTQQAKAHTDKTTQETQELSAYLEREVTIHNMARGGRLIIGYKSVEDLKSIIKKIIH